MRPIKAFIPRVDPGSQDIAPTQALNLLRSYGYRAKYTGNTLTFEVPVATNSELAVRPEHPSSPLFDFVSKQTGQVIRWTYDAHTPSEGVWFGSMRFD